MQETQTPSLVWEDPTCHMAAKPVGHNYWACALGSPQAATAEALTLEPVLHNKRNHPA